MKQKKQIAAVLALVLAVPALASAQATPSPEPKRKRVVTDMSGFELAPANLSQQTTVVGATRSLGGMRPPAPTLLAPHVGRALGPKVTLAWMVVAPTNGFTLVVQDESGKELSRQSVALTQAVADASLFPGQTYQWTVATAAGSPPSAAATIRVLSADERKAVEAELAKTPGDSFDARIARARVLAKNRLWYDAVEAYTALIAAFPDRAAAYEERGQVYSQLPVTKPFGDADFAQADTKK